MKPGEIYEIQFPYEEGHGFKKRPVLVFVLTSTENEFIGLKITGTKREENRVEIKYWQEAGLDKESYVQCDFYSVFTYDGALVYKGTLKQEDYDRVVIKFNEFYPVLKWQKQYEENLK